MTKPATKKSPTSPSCKSNDAGPQVDTPKRSGSRIPVPLSTVDAGASPQVRAAGSAFVWLCAEDRDEDVTAYAMDARNDLAGRVHEALDSPEGEAASVLTDLAIRHVIRGLTPKVVRDLVQSHPELVLEARRHVEAAEGTRV